ncbi:RecF/RecN/SMC protein [Gymnopus androsaceus JB14]|uniref:Structural maintenance of chromosomes protein n=1 Tax=Gymnopus androsaceus JB14 TaxID=1447944 RepID=A0A6A4IH38_9AGAR|nr:RecF/RecN/SMC protein [Gymnopus androsaceus JB14]
MPPRRSSRPRASVEPTPVETAPMKRKRSQPPVVDVVDLEEKENLEKPPSRSRRASSVRLSAAASARSRASTRREPAEPTVEEEEVPETDDDEEAPPTKKKRPSLEPEDDSQGEDNDSEEEIPKSKPRRATKPKQTVQRGRSSRVPSRSNRPQKPVLISDDEVDPDVQMKEESEYEETRSAPQSRSKQTAKRGRGRPSRASIQKPTPVPKETDGDEQESEVEEYVAPKRKGKAPLKSKREQTVEEEQEDPKVSFIADEEEEEEEEKSLLFDHPPTLPPASQPQAKIIPEEPKGPQPRLVIHKLALVNFKSYAGRQEIGPFHKSFSSIVGANGSGKSNTIDALLFVFGFRATKMRQAKVSELIHNSARYPDLTHCSVEIHFREIIDLPGLDEFEVVPGSSLVVARRATKDNKSNYTVNGRERPPAEVKSLLKGRGIDLDHNRFLILQGEVESIAQMKPKGGEHDEGLLEYLEDIIGTSQYKVPIEEAFAALEKMQENRQEKLNRLRLIEKEKNSLEDKKKEAEDYLRLQNELVRARSKLYQWYLWQTLNSETTFRSRLAKVEADLEAETEKNKGDVQRLAELQAHYQGLEKAYKEVQKVLADAVKELNDHEKQEIGVSEKRKHAAGKAKKLKKNVTDAQNALRTAQHTIEDSEEKIEIEKGKLEEHETNLAAEEKVLEEIQDSLRDKTQKFYDQKEVLQRDLQPWTAKINAKQKEVDIARGERDALVKKVETIKTDLEEAEEFVTKVRTEQEEKVEMLGSAKREKAELKVKIESATAKLTKAQAAEKDWRAKASSSSQRVQEAKSSQVETRSQGKVLDSLTRMQSSGRITGFHGRLGSLGTIAAQYDVAITTACPSLNHMVVDTVDEGQKCLEYLRSQNIGRATFLVLEKISYPQAQLARAQTPENAPRLFDLITPKDPKFAQVFYKAVGDTLVAKDMDQANRIAFQGEKRNKVVTLAGQVIETSGAMSGGGGAPAKGGMSAKLAKDAVSPRQLQDLEQARDEAQSKLEEVLRDVRSAEAELEELNRAGPEIDLRYEKLGLDIQQGKVRMEQAEKRLKDLRTNSKPDKEDVARISTLEKNITVFEEALEGLKEKAGEIEAALREVEEKIMKIGGSKLMAQKSKVEGLRTHINLTNDAITTAEVAKAKAEKDVVKHTHTINSDATALEQAEEDLAGFDKDLADLKEYMQTLKENVEEAETAEENQRENLVNEKAELDSKAEEVEAFRQTENKLRKAQESLQKEIETTGAQVEHYQNLHDELALEDIDDDEEDEGEDGEGGTEHQGEDKKSEGVRTMVKKKSSIDLYTYRTNELQKFKERDMKIDVQALEDKIGRAKPNLNVLKEYKERETEFLRRHDDLEKVIAERDAQKKTYEDLRKQRLEEFMAGFSTISLKLKEMYQMITQGGNAELELVDSMDPFAEGIIFSVMPPKKSWKNISNLSGGEKTLSSLALVFALHVFKPTPLYFMDEIDAALDFRNVSIIANYIKDRTKNAQFIIISLRNDMFELSHRLIGIYKTANVTQSISIDNHALTARPVNTASMNSPSKST